MVAKTVNFKVGMTCEGCSGAVGRILSKIEGVTKVDTNVETKSVVVTCEEAVEDATLLGALQKWSASSGKSVELISA